MIPRVVAFALFVSMLSAGYELFGPFQTNLHGEKCACVKCWGEDGH